MADKLQFLQIPLLNCTFT